MLRRNNVLVLLIVFLAACQADSRQQILATDQSQVALRSIQSRVFDTTDQQLTNRTVISTLQDLGFTIDRVDETLGVVTATKADTYLMKMTVTSRPRGSEQIFVRASAQFNIEAVSDPEIYQRFFDSLAQAMFLEAHEVR